jgi:peptide deformylase
MTKIFKNKLPPYVVINDPSSQKKDVLRTPTELITFPLDEETRKVIRQLEEKFDGEENCGGLAAPQIGYNKRVIVLAADDEELKKYRDDFTDRLPKSIWINPSFKPVSSKKTTDWEACFSVNDLAAEVPRFTEITYEAWTPEGEKVTGRVKGFLARLIQHEIDHLNGVLFIDHVPEDELVSR